VKATVANESGRERDSLALVPLGSIYRKWWMWVLYALHCTIWASSSGRLGPCTIWALPNSSPLSY